MAKALVVCPATETLEMIEFAETPLGVLIHACSRFRPATGLACGRACARRGRCNLSQAEGTFELDDDTDLEIDVDAPIEAACRPVAELEPTPK